MNPTLQEYIQRAAEAQLAGTFHRNESFVDQHVSDGVYENCYFERCTFEANITMKGGTMKDCGPFRGAEAFIDDSFTGRAYEETDRKDKS